MSITGARTSIRRPIFNIMVMALTSLVMRVMRGAEEKRSMSAKENSCIPYQRGTGAGWRRSPWLAKVAYLAESTPKAMDSRERASMTAPSRKI